jgi:hypothetical protein
MGLRPGLACSLEKSRSAGLILQSILTHTLRPRSYPACALKQSITAVIRRKVAHGANLDIHPPAGPSIAALDGVVTEPPPPLYWSELGTIFKDAPEARLACNVICANVVQIRFCSPPLISAAAFTGSSV